MRSLGLAIAILGISIAQVSAESKGGGASDFAPGQKQAYPGQAKKYAPGQRQKKPGQAKKYAPGQQYLKTK
jgi:hypothetical protein